MSIFGKKTVEESKTSVGPVLKPPEISAPKKELPDPPFNATIARTYAKWKEEEAINTVKNAVWNGIVEEVKKGGVKFNIAFDLHPYHLFADYTDVERACNLLSPKLYKTLTDFGKEMVKIGYTVTIINDVYSDRYIDEKTREGGRRQVGYHSPYSLDNVKFIISWSTGEDGEPYLKTEDHSGVMIRKIEDDNTEYFIRPEKIATITKTELEAEG